VLFFGRTNIPVSVDQIADWLQAALIDGEIESDVETSPGSWTSLTLNLASGDPVVEIERYSAKDGTLEDKVQDTVRQLLDHKNPVKPTSAVKWLCQYMSQVKVLYEFRPLKANQTDQGWKLFYEVWTNLRQTLQGIVHLDEEGFTNEDGAQITWEYPGEETGDLKVAVLNETGEGWIEYTIDLANREQVELFMAGKVPDKTK
jgi:hypothetical protein